MLMLSKKPSSRQAPLQELRSFSFTFTADATLAVSTRQGRKLQTALTRQLENLLRALPCRSMSSA